MNRVWREISPQQTWHLKVNAETDMFIFKGPSLYTYKIYQEGDMVNYQSGIADLDTAKKTAESFITLADYKRYA